MTQLAKATVPELLVAVIKKLWARAWVRWFVKLNGITSFALLLLRYAFMKTKPVQGKTVLITGGAGGLGKSMAIQFVKNNVKRIVLWDLNGEMLSTTQKELKAMNPQIEVVTDTVDISSKAKIYAAADALLEKVGFVDIVINNAGILGGKPILEQDDKRIQMVFDVNCMALFWMTKKFLPSMLDKNEGHIVVVSSLAGIFASPLMVDYSASKFAAKGFTDALRMELSKLGKSCVKTLCVCPAAMQTELFKGFSIPGMPAMSPDYVAGKVVNAIKSEDELLIAPRLAPSLGIISAAFVPVWLNDLFNKPASNTMAKFDGSKANQVFAAMEKNRER